MYMIKGSTYVCLGYPSLIYPLYILVGVLGELWEEKLFPINALTKQKIDKIKVSTKEEGEGPSKPSLPSQPSSNHPRTRSHRSL
ncbi:hypothetical protein MA16_Dca019984 [Dendrobium catenatum]|uniref:Uncharacterized protein n=1 Tax=Dendrobium catenatum TaxID=906689 RepID=A0A2I0WCN5_9ASPA|nr:hypothetical protein MA16_Dca019984 [Dendrobium catenatum]